MKKCMTVEGMMCNHCKMAVEKVLKKVDGVADAVVDLAAKQAEVTLTADVADDVLAAVVNEEGFETIKVESK